MREGGDAAEAPRGRAAVRLELPRLSAAELAALDDEEPRASTRRAFIGISFAAGVVCLMPQQWASGALCLAVSLGLYVWHRKRSVSEESASEAGTTQSTRENASSP